MVEYNQLQFWAVLPMVSITVYFLALILRHAELLEFRQLVGVGNPSRCLCNCSQESSSQLKLQLSFGVIQVLGMYHPSFVPFAEPFPQKLLGLC